MSKFPKTTYWSRKKVGGDASMTSEIANSLGIYQWIGFRENLQETMVFYQQIIFSCKFSHHPILWIYRKLQFHYGNYMDVYGRYLELWIYGLWSNKDN